MYSPYSGRTDVNVCVGDLASAEEEVEGEFVEGYERQGKGSAYQAASQP